MSVEITDAADGAVGAVRAAANAEWDFKDWDGQIQDAEGRKMSASGESALCGGESEEEFAQRLAGAIWKANRAFCPVKVRATYLEEVPFEEYVFDEGDYEELFTATRFYVDSLRQAGELYSESVEPDMSGDWMREVLAGGADAEDEQAAGTADSEVGKLRALLYSAGLTLDHLAVELTSVATYDEGRGTSANGHWEHGDGAKLLKQVVALQQEIRSCFETAPSV